MMECYTEKDFDEKYQEKLKVRNAIFTLKQFCDKFDGCEDCWLHEILKRYGTCPVVKLNNAAKEWEDET